MPKVTLTCPAVDTLYIAALRAVCGGARSLPVHYAAAPLDLTSLGQPLSFTVAEVAIDRLTISWEPSVSSGVVAYQVLASVPVSLKCQGSSAARQAGPEAGRLRGPRVCRGLSGTGQSCQFT